MVRFYTDRVQGHFLHDVLLRHEEDSPVAFSRGRQRCSRDGTFHVKIEQHIRKNGEAAQGEHRHLCRVYCRIVLFIHGFSPFAGMCTPVRPSSLKTSVFKQMVELFGWAKSVRYDPRPHC
jgi:hypothetical protein